MVSFSLHCEVGLIKTSHTHTQCFMTWENNNLNPYPYFNSNISKLKWYPVTIHPKASKILFTFVKIFKFPIFNLQYLPSWKCIEHRGQTIITKAFKRVLMCGQLRVFPEVVLLLYCHLKWMNILVSTCSLQMVLFSVYYLLLSVLFPSKTDSHTHTPL